MSQFYLLYQLARADLLERARRYSFLVTLGLTIFLAYLALPPQEANYLTLGLGHYRGVYNSAWVGGVVAVWSTAFLSLPAFYLVKNAIERDEETKVGQIIATTPLTRIQYTLAKTVSNFGFLSVMVGVMAVAAGAMQIIRAEVLVVDPWALMAPFILVALPAMAMIAGLAVLFETIGWLRGTFGNVVYFILWFIFLMVSVKSMPSDPHRLGGPPNDPLGIAFILSPMMKGAAATFPDYGGRYVIGAALLDAPLQTFVWEGIRSTPEIVLGRFLWVGLATAIGLLSAFFFRRFDPAFERSRRARAVAAPSDPQPAPVVERETYSAHLSPLTARRGRRRFGSLLLAELRLMLKGTPWWWLLITLASVVASLLVPMDFAWVMLALVWLLPLALWSSMGCREARFGTRQLVFSAPHPLRAQLPAIWLAGVLVTLLMGGGVAIRYGLASDWMHLLAWGTAVLFIPTLALAFGVLSGGSKLFEVVYMVLWYAGPINHVPYLDFTGAGAKVDLAVLSAYGICILGLLGAAAWARRQKLQT